MLVLQRRFEVVRSADIGFYRSCKIVVSYFQVCSVLGLVLNMPLETLVPAYAKITALSKVLWLNIKAALAQFRSVGFDHFSVWAIEVIIEPVCMWFACGLRTSGAAGAHLVKQCGTRGTLSSA